MISQDFEPRGAEGSRGEAGGSKTSGSKTAGSGSRLVILIGALAVATLIAIVAGVNTGAGDALRYLTIAAAVVVGVWLLFKINGEINRQHQARR